MTQLILAIGIIVNCNQFMKKIIPMLAAMIIPLDTSEWTMLKYNKIPSHQMAFQDQNLVIKVDKSASPIVHKLKVPFDVAKFQVDLEITGGLNPAADGKFPEDSLLRMGLVAKGDKKLGWFQKKIAAGWVLKLFDLASKDEGLDKIYFFNLDTTSSNIGKKRIHPNSDLIFEEIVQIYDGKTPHISFQASLPPITTLALWLSTDGDQTGSRFEVKIKKIAIESPTK